MNTVNISIRAPHCRSGKAERARQDKLAHPELTTAEVAARNGMSPRSAYAALRLLRPRTPHKRAPRPHYAVKHPVLARIAGDPRRHPVRLRIVSADGSHPEHSPRQPPATRADCPTERPCPHLSCRHHMATDHHEKGVKVLDLPEHVPTCSLDVAAEGERTLEDVAAMLGLTRERVRQIEQIALLKVRLAGGSSIEALAAHHRDPVDRRSNWDDSNFGEAG